LNHLSSNIYFSQPIIRYFYDQYLSSLSQGKLSLVYIDEEDFRYAEKYDYDARGRVIKQTNYFNAILDSLVEPGTTSHYIWKITSSGSEFNFEYNQADQLTKAIYPDLTEVRYSYDDRGRLDQIGTATDPDKYADRSYTRRNETEQVKLGNAIQTVDYAYNSRGWLTSINEPKDPGDRFAESLYYKINPLNQSGYKNGNISGDKIYVDGYTDYRKFIYDRSDRLSKTLAVIPPNSYENKEEFTYNKNGNFLNAKYYRTGSDYDNINYQYSANTNRLSGVSGTIANSFTYDYNGNLKTESADSLAYFYSLYNRLSRVETKPEFDMPPRDSIEFWYNADGLRVNKRFIRHFWEKCDEHDGSLPWSKFPPPGIPKLRVPEGEGDSVAGMRSGVVFCLRSDTTTTRYYLVGGKVMMETRSSQVGRTRYIYAGEDRIAMIDPAGTIYYYLKDHLGSTRVVLKEDGTVFDKQAGYKAYGDIVSEVVSLNQAYKYTGKPLDSERGINHYYFGARYYDPTLGRWLSRG